MKICIDISQIVYPGGVGEYTKKLVEHLLKTDRKNSYRLLAYSLRQKTKILSFTRTLDGYQNWKLVYFPWPVSMVEPMANRVRWPKLEQLVGPVDIYHASDWVQFPAKAKIVATMHDLAPVLFPQYHHPKIVKVHQRRLNLIRRYADAVIAVSESTKRDFEKHFRGAAGVNTGCSASHNTRCFSPGGDSTQMGTVPLVTVIYEAPVVTPGIMRKQVPEINSGQALKQVQDDRGNKPYILTVSSLNPRKNIRRLVAAFGIFHQAHPEYQLVVAGSFGWGEKYRDQPSIVFAGKVSDRQLAAYYLEAALFVYPSLYEGFGLPVLEAMSFGVPVVTSKVSSLPEIAGTAAILVDPESETAIAGGMEQALAKRDWLARLGKGQAAKFSWEKCAHKTLNLYTKLVSKSEIRSASWRTKS